MLKFIDVKILKGQIPITNYFFATLFLAVVGAGDGAGLGCHVMDALSYCIVLEALGI